LVVDLFQKVTIVSMIGLEHSVLRLIDEDASSSSKYLLNQLVMSVLEHKQLILSLIGLGPPVKRPVNFDRLQTVNAHKGPVLERPDTRFLGQIRYYVLRVEVAMGPFLSVF
jgi:hypothetical protein